ncbi:peptide deformylase [Microgenomates group bacterium RBG_16_45_19]|nr:MAG: peptide deformylase [Microgenomates group bacterium RBG_16_45_19]
MTPSIITVPDPKLRQISQPVKSLDTKTTQFIKNLTSVLQTSATPGVGLSAIQVGVPLQLFITAFPKDPNLPLSRWSKAKTTVQVYLNPHLVNHSTELTLGDDPKNRQLEGCLSIPHVWGHVWRYQWIDLEFIDPGSNYLTTRFSGFAARVIQHEYDHLNGILFTDHLLGKSPIPGFTPLKIHHNHLFFEIDDHFTPVEKPEELVAW